MNKNKIKKINMFALGGLTPNTNINGLNTQLNQWSTRNQINSALANQNSPNIGNTIGQIGNVASGLFGVTSNVVGNLSTPEYTDPDFNTTSKSDLFNRVDNFQGVNLGRSNFGSSALSGAASGAAAGSVLGPVGTAIGGVFGGLASGISSIFGNNKRRREERRANERAINSMNGTNLNINSQLIDGALSTQLAKGGRLAYGGFFSNGVEQFNTGGTHEANPYGGIPQGVNENGEPNLVEENEVKWNNYIFSDRLTTESDTKEYLLPSMVKNKSYADAAMSLSKESEERELDPISKRGRDVNLSRLAIMQEMNRPIENPNIFAEGGGIHIKKENRGKFSASAKRAGMGTQEFARHVLANKDDYSSTQVKRANFARNASKWKHADGGLLNMFSASPNTFMNSMQRAMTTYGERNPVTPSSMTLFDPNALPELSPALERDSVYNILDQVGWPADQRDKAYEIIMRESGAIPNNYRLERDNPGGGNDLGLFQINSKYHPDMHSRYNMLDPIENARAALDIYNRYGWTPWRGNSNNTPKSTENMPTNTNTPSRSIPYQQEMINGRFQELGRTPLRAPSLGQSPVYPTTFTGNITRPNVSNSNPQRSNNYLGRYAPIAANIGLLASTIGSSPDQLNLGRVTPNTVNERLRYNPLDTDQLTGQIRRQGNALTRGIYNTSGGNRSIAQQGLIAANRQTQDAMGNAFLSVNETNENRLNRVQEFNRGTSQYNAGENSRVNTYNTQAGDRETMYNAQARATRDNLIRQGVSTIGSQLGSVATENRWFDIVPEVTGYTSEGRYARSVFSKGGNIFKRRIR